MPRCYIINRFERVKNPAVFEGTFFALILSNEVTMQEISTEDLKMAQKGDRKAFDRIITVYRAPVISVCMKYMRNNEEAMDMAQDVFVNAYSAIRSFGNNSKFSTWLYRIAVNLCINRRDAMKRRKYFDTDSIHGDENDGRPIVDPPDRTPGQDEMLEKKSLREIIFRELDSFENVERSVIILRDMEGYEYDEISRILEMPLGSVKSRLSRAREKLRNRILKRTGVTHEL
jgi:RNA polymerase sigma-70 factor (ECF subfamily)